jgi:aryl-alcohol dehydrogenase-like predicted oxidoreductase
MEYTKLGKSDLNVSRVCLGCMSFGEVSEGWHEWVLNQEQTDEMIKKALDLGINFFDTANIYGKGSSETFIGNSFKKLVKNRSDIIVATKVYFNEGCLSKEAILREIDSSLKRLQLDYVDLYIIHRWDYDHPIEETMEALNEVVKQGKARYIGCSAMYPYQLLKANMIARQNNWKEFISIQNHYNIIYREDERELAQLIEEEGMSMTPYSPLAAGRVCRMWSDDTLRSKTDKTAVKKYDDAKETDLPIVKRIKEIADKMKISMAQVSLAWLLSKKLVASPIIGCTKISQLEDLVKAVKVKLSDDDIKYLEELYKPHNIVGALKKGDVPDVKKRLVDKK